MQVWNNIERNNIMTKTYIETTNDKLELGDWVDAQYGIAEVIEITDKTIKLAYFTCKVKFSTPKEYTGFDKSFKSYGTEWDGGIKCKINGNEHLFQYGLTKREAKFGKRRGMIKAIGALKVKNKNTIEWKKDFYLG